jgi:hypothetical protein
MRTVLKQSIELEQVRLDLIGRIDAANRRCTTDQDKLQQREIDKPIQRVLTELQAKVKEAEEKVRGAGLDEAAKALTKGMADAEAAVARVNAGWSIEKHCRAG